MLDKLHKQHTTNSNYVKPKSNQVRAFGIVHFAGVVNYSADGFLEKNRDTFSNDLFDLLATSKATFITQLFKNERAMVSGQ
jgi:myosin-7